MLFDTFKIILVPHPLLGLGGPGHTGEPDHGSPGHTIIGDPGGDPAPSQGPTASVGRGHEAALGVIIIIIFISRF